MSIVIAGATGKFGSLAAAALIRRGVSPGDIVAAGRNADGLAGHAAKGLRTARIDMDDRASLDAAFAGAQSLLLVSVNGNPRRVAQHREAIEAARAAGIGMIVYTSFLRCDSNSMHPDHYATELILRDCGVPYVILRNASYFDFCTRRIPFFREQGRITGAAGEGLMGAVARVYNRHAGIIRRHFRRPREGVADDDDVRVPGGHPDGIGKRLALAHRAARRVCEADDLAAKAQHGRLEGKAGSGAGFEEERCEDAIQRLGRMNAVEIRAICDVYDYPIERAKDFLKSKGCPEPAVYTGSNEAWKGICERDDLDLIYVLTPTFYHAEMAVHVLTSGKHAAVEVSAAQRVDDLEAAPHAVPAAEKVQAQGLDEGALADPRHAADAKPERTPAVRQQRREQLVGTHPVVSPRRLEQRDRLGQSAAPVSYTHLTLPTTSPV